MHMMYTVIVSVLYIVGGCHRWVSKYIVKNAVSVFHFI